MISSAEDASGDVTRDVSSHVALMASLGLLRASGRSRHLAVCMRVPKGEAYPGFRVRASSTARPAAKIQRF